VPSHTPRPLASSASLLLNVSSTSATGSHSSAAKPRLPRTLPYVYCQYTTLDHTLTHIQNEYAEILHKRVGEAKAKEADLRKRRASSMRK